MTQRAEQINVHNVYKGMNLLIDKHNANVKGFLTQRITTNGTKTIQRKSTAETLKAPVITTATMIVRRYIKAYNKALETSPNLKPNQFFITSTRKKESKLARSSEKTPYNHIKRLINANIIIKERGSVALTINPDIVFHNPLKNVDNSTYPHPPEQKINKPEGENPIFLGNTSKILPPNNVLKKQYSITIEAECVVENKETYQGNNRNPIALGYSAPSLAIQISSKDTVTQGGAAVAQKAEILSRLPQKQLDWLKCFWVYARPMLYNNRYFSDNEQVESLYSIYEGCFFSFDKNKQFKDHNWEDLVHTLQTRIDMAAKNLSKNGLTPDLPFECGKKKSYFDPYHHKGFVATEKWLEKNTKVNSELQAEKFKKQVIRDFQAQKAGMLQLKNNPSPSVGELHEFYIEKAAKCNRINQYLEIYYEGFKTNWAKQIPPQKIKKQKEIFYTHPKNTLLKCQ